MKHEHDTPFQDERFLLLETLGRGGMGAVYRAFDRSEQRLVALKVPSDAEQHGPAHPLSTEFDVWSRLDHPGVVRAFELKRAEAGPLPPGTPYLVLEHVDGGPLHRVLRPGRIEASTVESVAFEILSALDHLHAFGFVHRDLKPANVLMQRASDSVARIKLTDFGLASPLGTSRRCGIFSGSLPYASPEALSGFPLDGRCDLYALGILLYYLVTGRMPLDGTRPDEIVRWHLSGPPADPRRADPTLPRGLSRLIRRSTRRNRDERPGSAREALELLDRGPAPRPAPHGPAAPHGGARSDLRLALDAVRLGASRVRLLPRSSSRNELLREVSVWAQVRGLRFYRLRADPARLILQLIVERGAGGGSLIRRYGLRHSLSLDLLGGAPLLDRPGTLGPREAVPVSHATAARGICDFLLDCAGRRPMVLCVESAARRRPLVRELQRRLVEAVSAAASPAATHGGLLLLIEPAQS